MRIARLRRSFYRAGRVLGDTSAVTRGPASIAKRIQRRIVWRLAMRALRWIRLS
jgi:hypothetical protein